MPHATTSSSKRKGGKVNRPGGLGGPGGRGGRRWATNTHKRRTAPELPGHILDKSPRAIAAAVKRVAEGQGEAYGTSYRTAMAAISSYANRNSKSMMPERRKKLELAKDELRTMFDRPQNSKGEGGPGKKRAKAKAKSRRNPR